MINICGFFSGLYSQKAFTRLGFEIRSEYKYLDYVDENGVRIFSKMEEPHKTVALMTKSLSI